jgi:hypothetical protein
MNKKYIKKRGGNVQSSSSTDTKKEPLDVRENPKPPGIFERIFGIIKTIILFIISGIAIIYLLGVLLMCGVFYMMIHFVLLAVNGIIKLIRSIFPFLKKKLKPIKVWPHELILDALGIKFDSNDPTSGVSELVSGKDDYCPSKKK